MVMLCTPASLIIFKFSGSNLASATAEYDSAFSRQHAKGSGLGSGWSTSGAGARQSSTTMAGSVTTMSSKPGNRPLLLTTSVEAIRGLAALTKLSTPERIGHGSTLPGGVIRN